MQTRILGAIALLVAIAMAWGARDYVAPIAYEPIGPRAVPMLLASLMGLVGAWMLVRGEPPGTPADRTATPNTPLLPVRVIIATVAIVIYALLFEVLGFTLATALMTVPVARLFGGSWKQGVITGLAMGLILFLVFDRLLDVVLPAGLLKGVL